MNHVCGILLKSSERLTSTRYYAFSQKIKMYVQSLSYLIARDSSPLKPGLLQLSPDLDQSAIGRRCPSSIRTDLELVIQFLLYQYYGLHKLVCAQTLDTSTSTSTYSVSIRNFWVLLRVSPHFSLMPSCGLLQHNRIDKLLNWFSQ